MPDKGPRARRFCIDRSIENPSAKPSAPPDIFRAAIQETLKRRDGSWCHFNNVDSSVWAEVAPSAEGLRIHLPYLHEEGLGGVLAEQGVNVPERWRIVEFYGKNRRFPDCVTYLAPEEDLGRIILFIDRFFANTDRKGANYGVCGSVRW